MKASLTTPPQLPRLLAIRPQFQLWFRVLAYSFCIICIGICWNRKGAPERIQFPTLSQTVSPFQQLGIHLAILGKKIDGAQLVQARPTL